MDTNMNYTPEELQAILEKAQKELQEKLDSMTPEEREQAQLRAQQAIEDDAASMQKLIDDAAKVAAGDIPAQKPAPKFCPNCGAPAGEGKFCSFCGGALQND